MMACPKCGSTIGYKVRVRALGYTVHIGDWSGTNERISDESELRGVADKTVSCLECGGRTLMKKVREL